MNASRRQFLASSAAWLGAGCLASRTWGASTMTAKIARVEAWPINYPVAGHFKFFEASKGRPAGRPAVVVKITTEDGAVGWGESVPTQRWSYETLESVHTTITNYLAPVLVGLDALDRDAIHAAMHRTIAPSFSTGQPICKAGIDLALWDLAGKLSGKTLAELWGRRGKDRITLSWTLNPRTLDEIEPLIAEGRRRGFQNFNVKVAPDPKFDLAMCRLVKQLAPDGFLWADANGGYEVDTALAVAPQLADVGVAVLEQPVPANRLSGFRRLKQQGALPIILDEGVVSCVDLEEFIQLDLLDGVAMKHARCGGLTEARQMIEMLQQRGLMFLGSGLTDPDLSLAAALALYGAYELNYPAALNGPQFLTSSILRQPLDVVDGELAVPTGPGLGVEVDEAKLQSHVLKDLY
jgi:L-alanine-DL-glutamate epimerase-like enolase superfamily enzyme